jgi:DNA-binding MarR family transcriptional regulator
MCNHSAVSDAPDTAVLLDQLGHLLRQLTRLTGAADDALPMTASQRIALIEIGRDGPFRLSELAERMGTSTPTASRAVDGLEGLGLVTRTPEPADRRALSIELSPEGQRLFDERHARAASAFEPATAALGPADRRKLLDLLRVMTDALSRPRA